MKIGGARGGVSAVGKPGTANQFQRRELVAVPVLRHTKLSPIPPGSLFPRRAARATAPGKGVSSPPSHLSQPLQLRLRLLLHPLLFIRTADRKVLAVPAAVLARGGGERSVDDGPIDGFQHVLRAAPRPIVQRDVDGGVILRDGGVVEAPYGHRLSQDLDRKSTRL